MECCSRNVGDVDRGVRIVVGLAALYGYTTNVVDAPLSYLLLIVAIAMFFTALTGSCMLYSLLGVNTCSGACVKEKMAASSPAKKAAKKKKK